ncbi:MAG: hypothetical protein KBD19_04890 [Candidatus Moranbacteria bacterium]|nr:hypothetical protein [Candidatus Moranbacteria bacterium]
MIPSFPQNASGREAIDAEKRAAFRRIQSEYLIFDQDRQKKSRYHESLEMEIRKLGTERDRLEIRLEEKMVERDKVSRELGILEAEGKRLKRKMNLLS